MKRRAAPSKRFGDVYSKSTIVKEVEYVDSYAELINAGYFEQEDDEAELIEMRKNVFELGKQYVNNNAPPPVQTNQQYKYQMPRNIFESLNRSHNIMSANYLARVPLAYRKEFTQKQEVSNLLLTFLPLLYVRKSRNACIPHFTYDYLTCIMLENGCTELSKTYQTLPGKLHEYLEDTDDIEDVYALHPDHYHDETGNMYICQAKFSVPTIIVDDDPAPAPPVQHSTNEKEKKEPDTYTITLMLHVIDKDKELYCFHTLYFSS